MARDRDAIIQSLKRYFSITELVCPDVYKRFNERAWQFFTTDALYGLLLLRETILCRPMYLNNYKKGITQRGLRCNLCALVKGKATVYLSQHCFDQETEILTDNGWRKYNTISDDDMVFSYNLNTSEIELKPIGPITTQEYSGPMYHFSSLNIDVLATSQHRMVTRQKSVKYVRVRPDKPISEKWQRYLDSKKGGDKWHIETAEQIANRRVQMLCAAKSHGDKECDLTLWKLALATIADGYFSYQRGTPAIGFHVKKERKCKAIEDVLTEIGSPITKSLDKNGAWNYYVRSAYAKQVLDIIGPNKRIPIQVLRFSGDTLRELVHYYAQYDGCVPKRENDRHFSISSTSRWNIDMLQTMCALSGMRSQINVIPAHEYNINGTVGQSKEAYNITINPDLYESRVDKRHFSVEDYSGIVWCVSNENGTVVTRRNGLITIQGNCFGNAFDFTVDGMTAEQARQEIKKKAHLFPCQIRLEKDKSWVHIDFLSMYGITSKVYEFNG